MQDLNHLSILQKLGVKRKYSKGAIIFFEGEMASKFFLLLKGSVRIYKSSDLGAEKTLHIFKPVSFIAEMPSFNNAEYPASAACEDECEVLVMDSNVFKKELENTQFCFTFINSLLQKIKILESHIDANNKNLSDRFLAFALQNKATLHTLTQRKIAQVLNTSAESLSRILKKLKEENKIKIDKGRVYLLIL